ncbi:hypothetical protein Tco_0820823 [Tanacetum coccineum]|uniref:Uncharacterized protein n=1 Tax=Tanacetum coccineum TaxID=301880 RepID=A0ABQ5AET6_9ASTR
MEQMTSICDMVGQIMQKKEEEKRIAEDQAAKDRYWKIPVCYDDDEDYTIVITHVLSTKEAVDSLIMEDEHLDTISGNGTTNSEDELQDKRIRSSAFGESKSHSWTPNRILSCFITTHREVDWIASLLPDQGGERFIGFRVIVELQSYEIVIDEDSCSSPITALIFITTLLLLAALSEAFLEGVAGVDKIKDS